jgi:Tfp pilus assembly major pilin PilA
MIHTTSIKKQNGFSLISVLVAAGLLGGLSMVMMQMGKQSTKATAKMNFDTEVNQITNEINGILSDPASCTSTVTNASPPTFIIKNIPNNTTPVYKYDITKGPYGNGSVQIDSYVLNLTGSGADIPNLQINFKNKAILVNQSQSNAIVSRIIKLDVTQPGTTLFSNIQSCRSVSTATDTMWSRQIGVNANIFYNSGNVGIGTNTPQYPLDVTGTASVGGVVMISDIRLKSNILPLKSALTNISALNGVVFSWNDLAYSRGVLDEGRQIGLIAQDVEKVFPEAVKMRNDGFKSVNYPSLIAPLVEAIKELKAENEILREWACKKDKGMCSHNKR